MKVLFLGRRHADKIEAIESLLDRNVIKDKGTTVYTHKLTNGTEIEIWDVDSLNVGFGEAYCIGADACIMFGSNYLEKRVKEISPKAKVHKYSNINKLLTIINNELF